MRIMYLTLFLTSILSGSNQFFPLNDVKKGMRGIGLTSFSGEKIDTFDVEVIDVLKGVGTGHTIVLARLESKTLRHTGILAGMSGSPVYIDGKLLGAVAYSWLFSKDPICGITPAEEMKSMVMNYGEMKNLAPLRGILAVSGIGLSPYLDTIASRFNLEVIPAGRDTGEGRVLPGSPAGIVLVDGDGVLAIMGTVTFVEGNRIYLFGHPALLSGDVALPFATGRVSGVLPSLASSFKFITPLKTIGTTIWDGATGVIAEKGRKPRWIKLKMEVGGRVFNYNVADYPTIFTYLVSSLIFSGIAENIGGDFEGTVKSEMKITVSYNGREDLIKREIYFAGRGLHRYLTFYYSGVFDEILNNPAGRLKIKSLKIDVQPQKGVSLSTLKEVKLTGDEFRPGEEIPVKVIMGRFRKPDTSIVLDVKLPSVEGEYFVDALDDASLYREINSRSFGEPENIGKFVELLKGVPSNNVLSLIVVSQDKTFKGSETVLPPSRRIVAGELLDQGNRIHYVKRLKMNGEIRGIVRKRITVKGRK